MSLDTIKPHNADHALAIKAASISLKSADAMISLATFARGDEPSFDKCKEAIIAIQDAAREIKKALMDRVIAECHPDEAQKT